MTAFRYKALDADGKLVKGVLEETPIGRCEARCVNGISGLSKWRRPTQHSRPAKPGLSAPQSSFECRRSGPHYRQLATLIASALPLDECLQAVADQTGRPPLNP